MRTISHRELRNDSAAVLREVANGETFQVSNHGEVVATLVPAGGVRTDLRCVRPARGMRSFGSIRRHVIEESTEAALADLRADR